MNLTALREPQQIAIGHVLDSLSAVPLIRGLPGADSALDLGSGGGFPGLPLAVGLPLDRCALVDSVRKKAAFLGAAAAVATEAMGETGETAPAIQALAERAEDLADEPEHRGRWRLVLARAVGSVAEVAELALPLLAVGGHVMAWKRDAGDGSLRREVARARGVLRLAGAATADVRAIDGARDLGLEGHVLVVIRKIRPTPDHFPRPPAERRRASLA
jgi:16S rRNA (guanine527-N7)-methyltransferase